MINLIAPLLICKQQFLLAIHMKTINLSLLFILLWGLNAQSQCLDPTTNPVRISENKRFLVYPNGTPFFYLGDTAWELFHRLNREEVDLYLTTRAKQGYTVIQAVALAELDGLNTPNAYGHLPFIDFNPEKPAIKAGDNNDYWDHVDYIIDQANKLGMYIGLLPTWGRYWNDGTPLFNTQKASKYGRFIGERYKDKGIIWILGGDRPADSPQKIKILQAMAKGIKDGGATQLITFHPCGACGSAQWLHNEPWLDFNMRQNGHAVIYTGRYSKTLEDYQRTPIKPVMDAEPIYEDHPIDFNPEQQGHSTATDIRRTLYWNLFNGAFGHTYGHHSVWQMYDPQKKHHPINRPLMPWKEAINQPGAQQMIHGKKLMESRPFLTRIPDPNLIVEDEVQTSLPGAGQYRFVATRDENATYAMIYVPTGRKFSVRTSILKANKLKAWWYNPRDGKAKAIGTFQNQKSIKFISPTPGENLDWILVLDDTTSKYSAPGKKRMYK